MGNTSQTHAGPDSTGQHARDAGDRQNACRPLGIDNERKRSKAASAKRTIITNSLHAMPVLNANANPPGLPRLCAKRPIFFWTFYRSVRPLFMRPLLINGGGLYGHGLGNGRS